MQKTIVVAVAGLILLAGLPRISGAEEPVQAERFARYYLPWGYETPRGEWQPESTVPKDPQDVTKMIIWEVSRYWNADAPTPQQRLAQDKLIAACYAAARKNEWFRFEKGYDSGYRKIFDDKTHFGNESYALDNDVLNPERPEFLMYYNSPLGKRLVGFMFLVDDPTGEGAQIAGPETIWHYHIWPEPFCLAGGLLIIGRPNNQGVCERGTLSHRSPEMLHVWLIDHPDGPFATKMEIDTLLLPELLERRLEKQGY
jgi:hypothetical protein